MSNSESRFKEIYHTNYSRVIRICLGYVNGDETLAKDITQEVFIKVWENLPGFRKESAVSTWIYRITVNTCLLHIRNQKKKKAEVDTANLSAVAEENAHPEENQLKQLHGCIQMLSQTNRSLILLELEGLPQKEIADIVGLSHEAVRTRIHRIKNQLSKCVKNDRI